MIIQISEGIRISSESPMNFTIEKLRIVQEGKNAGAREWDAVGYHSSLKSAAISLLTRHFSLLEEPTGASAATDLKALIDAVDYGADLISRACQDRTA